MLLVLRPGAAGLASPGGAGPGKENEEHRDGRPPQERHVKVGVAQVPAVEQPFAPWVRSRQA